ncbi:hypothetical protein A8C32_03870 [Flavivirga aquatica]|uniref:Glycosyltransferase 2-like domain-containing protein n=1 Tax=Flavivirga aquatica TaxID=1849968 RepID=A0A1E5TB93_9FLAO|nr:glycosyltransferase [Flavivirga aquatica]OEK08597.1 hypothetical protein A8C32_03870 [Flavivirga aquatica]
MKLSIVVPCYNAEEHIGRCLNSLINQSLNQADYEIIVINDGSTDNSIKLIEEFKKPYKNVTIYSQQNKGLGAVRNKGMKLAKGDYIYFIDSDDYLAYNTLNIVLDHLIKFNLDLLGFKTNETEKLNLFSSSTKNIPKVTVTKGVDFMLNNKQHRYEAWWYIIKNEYLQKTGFQFEEGKFLEDVIFTFRILMNAKRFAFLPIDVHRYVKNPNSIMNNESQPHLRKLIAGYVSLVHRLNNLTNDVLEIKDSEYLKIIENIKYTSSLNTYFMFYKLIRSDISIKNINKILNNLNKINAYPFKRKSIAEVYSHYKVKISAIIFNNRWLFYVLLYPIRLLYKKQLIRLP